MEISDEALVSAMVKLISAFIDANPRAGRDQILNFVKGIQTNDSLAREALGQLARNPAASPSSMLLTGEPAVPVSESYTDDLMTCLECGQTMKMLKRHLRATHDLSPDEYRARWKLADDYPMTAKNYSADKAAQAFGLGLGRTIRKSATNPGVDE